MINWIIFVAVCVVTYGLISYFATLTGGTAETPWQAFLAIFSPIPFVIIVFANALYGLAIYYGFSVTKLAIPIALAIGALTAWGYSVLFLGKVFELNDLFGLVLVIVGIFFLN